MLTRNNGKQILHLEMSPESEINAVDCHWATLIERHIFCNISQHLKMDCELYLGKPNERTKFIFGRSILQASLNLISPLLSWESPCRGWWLDRVKF
jgi:hypothetical protein